MRTVFFGTGDYAALVVDRLLRSDLDMTAVVTLPDRTRGRGGREMSSPVKVVAAENERGCQIHTPEDPNCPSFLSVMASKAPDLAIVADYGRMLSDELLSVPSRYCINLHASLLPRWRGASPVNRAIIAGDEKTGNTVIRMTSKMDAGPVMLKEELAISSSEDATQLSRRLALSGAELLIEAARLISEGKESFTPQREEDATYAPKLTKAEGFIDWNEPAETILRKIRGLKPWPGTYTFLEGRRLNILKAAFKGSKSEGRPGQIARSGGMVVSCGSGVIEVEEIQPAGKSSMRGADFLRGLRSEGEIVLTSSGQDQR